MVRETDLIAEAKREAKKEEVIAEARDRLLLKLAGLPDNPHSDKDLYGGCLRDPKDTCICTYLPCKLKLRRAAGTHMASQMTIWKAQTALEKARAGVVHIGKKFSFSVLLYLVVRWLFF